LKFLQALFVAVVAPLPPHQRLLAAVAAMLLTAIAFGWSYAMCAEGDVLGFLQLAS
jgi:hypothetical protein